ncbi:hypothetical protein Q8A67_006410 [Cirrhinus molitorella]|uniref:Uncharacterized protein n=1 Tax=Cirrhinus molitorella TaxID=172907 RepID=A0AA88Q4G5_9TELE|nr:hypothetical protein Q8A67_006410 [Cirrhinus molitorella]
MQTPAVIYSALVFSTAPQGNAVKRLAPLRNYTAVISPTELSINVFHAAVAFPQSVSPNVSTLNDNKHPQNISITVHKRHTLTEPVPEGHERRIGGPRCSDRAPGPVKGTWAPVSRSAHATRSAAPLKASAGPQRAAEHRLPGSRSTLQIVVSDEDV